jgi:hypothetical protein
MDPCIPVPVANDSQVWISEDTVGPLGQNKIPVPYFEPNVSRVLLSKFNINPPTSDGHTFVYSLLRYRYRYIVSNGRY